MTPTWPQSVRARAHDTKFLAQVANPYGFVDASYEAQYETFPLVRATVGTRWALGSKPW
jgi:hypothetical protein